MTKYGGLWKILGLLAEGGESYADTIPIPGLTPCTEREGGSQSLYRGAELGNFPSPKASIEGLRKYGGNSMKKYEGNMQEYVENVEICRKCRPQDFEKFWAF